MKKSLLIDALIFTVLVLLGSAYPWFVRGTALDNPMIWPFVVAVPIAVYLGLRKHKNWKKILIGTFVFGVLFGAVLEYMAHITSVWQVPTTIFPFRILGASTIEALIGYLPMTLFVLVFYEHFFDKDITHKISPRIWYAIIPALIMWAVIIFLHFVSPSKLIFSYAYVKMGIAAIILMIVQIIRLPRLFSKYAKLAVSLFFAFFIFEIVGVTFNYWIFPGHEYLGMVYVFGQRFPIEEIIFWMFFYPATIAAYYEEFIDDKK